MRPVRGSSRFIVLARMPTPSLRPHLDGEPSMSLGQPVLGTDRSWVNLARFGLFEEASPDDYHPLTTCHSAPSAPARGQGACHRVGGALLGELDRSVSRGDC